MVVGFCFVLMFLFVPETFWDRTPRPHSKKKKTGMGNLSKIFSYDQNEEKGTLPTGGDGSMDMRKLAIGNSVGRSGHATIAERRQQRHAQHVGFVDQGQDHGETKDEAVMDPESSSHVGNCKMKRSPTTDQFTLRTSETFPKAILTLTKGSLDLLG